METFIQSLAVRKFSLFYMLGWERDYTSQYKYYHGLKTVSKKEQRGWRFAPTDNAKLAEDQLTKKIHYNIVLKVPGGKLI